MYVVCAEMEKVTKGKEHKDMFCGCFVFFFFFNFLTSSLKTTHTASVSISRLLHRCLQTPGTTLVPLIKTPMSLVQLCAFIVKAPIGLSHGRGPLF